MSISARVGFVAILLVGTGVFLFLERDVGLEPHEDGLPTPVSGRLDPPKTPPEGEILPSEDDAEIDTRPLPTETDKHPEGPCRLEGVVVGTNGKPLPRATVTIRLTSPVAHGSRKVGRPVTGKTDPMGRFLLERLPVGTWSVDAHDGVRSISAPVEQALSASDPAAKLQLTIVEGAVLAGLLRSVDGPVSNAEVFVDPQIMKQQILDPVGRRVVRTDAEGRYRLEGLRPKGSFRISMSHDGYYAQPRHQRFFLEGDQSLDLDLIAYCTVVGRVVNSRGAPVARAEVELGGAYRGRANDAGIFHLKKITPGKKPMELFAASEDLGLVGHLPVELALGEQKTGVDVELVESGFLEGRVTTTRGDPLPGAQVSVEPRRSRKNVARSLPSLGSSPAGISRDFDQQIQRQVLLDQLLSAQGELALSADASNSEMFRFALLSNDSEPTENPIRVLHSPGGPSRISFSSETTSEGLVISDHSDWIESVEEIDHIEMPNAPGLFFNGRIVGPGKSSAGRPLSALLRGRGHGATTDADGHYVVRGLLPGTYGVNAKSKGFLDARSPDPVDLQNLGDRGEINLSMARGGVIECVLDRPDGRIDGKLQIRIKGKSKGGSRNLGTKWCETYSIRDLAADTYTITARIGNDLVATAENVSVATDSDPVPVRLSLIPGSKVLGRVADEVGAPIMGAQVTASNNLGDVQRAKSGADGNYVIEGLLGGNYVVTASAKGFLASPPEKVEAHVQGQVTHDVALSRGVRLFGRIRDASGSPSGGVHVFARSGGDSPSVQTKPDGTFTFTKLAPAHYIIYARSEDRTQSARGEVELLPTHPQTQLDLQLAPSFTIEGKLTTADGSGLSGITLVATATDNPSLTRQGQSSPDGTFTIQHLYPGRYRITASPVKTAATPEVDVGPGRKPKPVELRAR